MASNNHYLDASGLTYLWGKIKGYVSGIINNLNIPSPGSTTPTMNGTGNTGTSTDYARADHVHPSDTSKADKVTGGTSGNLVALDANGNIVDAGVNASSVGTDTKNTTGSTADANKLFIIGAKTQAANPVTYSQANAYITAGKVYSNAKEVVNLSDTQTLTNKTLTSRTLDGTPTAPTATAGTNTQQIATTSFVTTAVSNAGANYVQSSTVGAANGVAPLDANSKIDSQYLPSYVDDVIESYPRSGSTELSQNWLSTTSGGSALTPESGKIYVLMTASTNYEANSEFRWGGTTYVQLNDSGCSSMTTTEMDNATSNWT